MGAAFLHGAVPALCAVAIAGCSAGATSDTARTALMRITAGQFVRGALPTDTKGPAVASIDLMNSTIWPGESDKRMDGSLSPLATAAALALSGDEGYWIVPASVPDFATPTLPTFHAVAAFSSSLNEGPYTLQVHAVDAEGNFGPPRSRALSALPGAPGAPVLGADLAVILSWESLADLDLHVVAPAGVEIYHGQTSSRESASATGEGGADGFLVADSDAGCQPTGKREEAIVWPATAPSGHYVVRVDTASLCGLPIAYWTVSVVRRGLEIAQAAGVSLGSDARFGHDRGAGVLALEVDLP